MAERAAAAIDSYRGEEPFFLQVGFLAPHDNPNGRGGPPVPAERHRGTLSGSKPRRPPSFDERDVRDKPSTIRRPRLSRAEIADFALEDQRRRESLLAVDDAVGEVVGALERKGQLDDTLIVFTSDNGWLEGEHRLNGKEAPYDESTRVPLVVRGPGFARGRIDPDPVTGPDVTATVVEAAEAKATLPLDGRSLRVTRAGRELLLEGLTNGARWRAIRTLGHLYIEWSTGERELYDLRADPFQLRSRDGDPSHRRVQADLAARLARVRACSGAGCP
jgi:arylsulfatase A-like enzyme